MHWMDARVERIVDPSSGDETVRSEREIVMTYVVAGVTGHTGSIVADSLLGQGKKVRVVVRDAAKGEPFRARGAEVAVADLADPKALAAALAGAEGAYLLLPPMQAEDVLAASAQITESFVTALTETRIPHVVFLSSIGAQLPSGTGPIAMVANAERRLATVRGTAFTFLRPAYFLENLGSALGGLADSVFPTFLADGRTYPMIATRDIGLVAARALVEGPSAGAVIELAGPVDPSVPELAAALSEVVGKPLTPAIGPVTAMADTLVSFGFGRQLAGLYEEMTTAMNGGVLVHEGGHRFERGTTTARDVFRALLAAG